MHIKGKIFIVDDNTSSSEFVSLILENDGYITQTATDATTSLEKIIIFQPNLIFLDIWMPVMNGYEVCAQLKSNKKTIDIPIIFISASNNTLEKVKGFQLGAVDYITKPFEKLELVARVNTHIQLSALKKEKEKQVKSQLKYNRQLKKEITQRKKLEHELKKAQQYTHIGSWYLDIATNEVQWTDELYKMYGFDPALPPPPYTEHKKLFTPESWELLSASLAKTTKNGIPYELELKTVRTDGSNGWMWVRGETVQNASGQTIGLWGAAQDISEFKKTEFLLQNRAEEILTQNEKFKLLNEELDLSNRKLLEAKRRNDENETLYHTVVANTPLVSFVLDNKGIFTLSEGKGLAKLGLLPGQVVGLSAFDVYKDFPQIINDVKFALKGNTLRSVADLGSAFFDVSYTPILDFKGNVMEIIGVANDISDQKLHEKELVDAIKTSEESETRFKALHNASFGGIMLHLNGTIFDCNQGLSNITGYSFNELVGMDGFQLVSEKSRNLVHSIIQSRNENPYEAIGRRKNGEEYPVRLEGRNIPYKGNEVRVVEFRDITEQKRIEAEINYHKSELQEYFENDISADYLVSAAGEIISCNKTFVEMFGFEQKTQAENSNITKLYKNASDRDELVLRVTKNKKIENCEVDFVDRSGNVVNTIINAIGLFDENNILQKNRGYVVNITQQKNAQREVLKLSKAIEQSPLSIVITNTDGNIEFVNPKFTEVTGYTFDEVVNKNPRIWQSGETTLVEYKELWKTILAAKEWKGEFRNRKKNGELYWESATIAPIIDHEGSINNYIAIKEDITRQKELMTELVIAKEKAEESDNLKSAFLANMSHEIRTPLNGILGFTELLVDPDFDPNEKENMGKIILDNGELLLSIINDILDISKIEAGQMKIQKSVFKVSQLVLDTINSFIPKAREKGLEIRLARDPAKCTLQINSDFVRLKQVLTNLVSNALKYTDEGYIEVGCQNNNNQPTFFVKDTGIGIENHNLQLIFDRFNRRDAYTKKASGTGLGLAIAKSFVELLGGEIWVESELGKGSTFYFSIHNEM